MEGIRIAREAPCSLKPIEVSPSLTFLWSLSFGDVVAAKVSAQASLSNNLPFASPTNQHFPLSFLFCASDFLPTMDCTWLRYILGWS